MIKEWDERERERVVDEQALRQGEDNLKQSQKHNPSGAIPNWVVAGWVTEVSLNCF